MATLKDIAAQAGVSVGTVDRILHNRGRFSSETADTVRRIAKELDYRPNLMARQLSRSAVCRIALVLPEPKQDSGYWALPLAGARKAARELQAFGVSLEEFHFDRYKPESFRRLTMQLKVGGEWDGILMSPLLESDAVEMLGELDAGIPRVFLDTDLPSAARLAYIGQDSYASGRLAARLLSMAAGGHLHRHNYLLVAPDTDNEHLENRIRGFRDRMDAEIHLCRVNVESDHDTKAFGTVLDTVMENPISGVFVVDASAHYVAEYLVSRQGKDDKEHRIPLVGYDLVPANMKWMEEGVIDFLLTQRPVEQGYAGVNRLFRKVFQDEEGPAVEFTPIDIVTMENLKYLRNKEEG